MTRGKKAVRNLVALMALLGVTLLGAYALQLRLVEREIAELPLVRLDPVVVIADHAKAKEADSTQVARNPEITTLR
jgi:hypothetical protein